MTGRTLALVVALTFLAWPFPCSIPECVPLLFDEGILLCDACDLAVHGYAGMAPSYMGRPLHRAALAGAFRGLGDVPWAGVAVSSLAAALSLLVVFSIGRRLADERAGLVAVIALAMSNLFGHYARTALAECHSLLFFLLALRSLVFRVTPDEPRVRDFIPAGMWLGLCLAANPRMALAAPWLAAVGVTALTARQLLVRVGFASAAAFPLAFEAFTRWMSPHRADAASSFSTYAKLNASYFHPGSLVDYPVMFTVFEGPVLVACAVLALGWAVRRPGLARSALVAGPALSYLVASLAFGHHALRYLVVYVPGLALACGVALAGRWPEMTLSRAGGVALVLAAMSALTRPSMPRGHDPVYPRVVRVLEEERAEMVAASHFPLIKLLRLLRGSRHFTGPPPATIPAFEQQLLAGCTHVVYDFEHPFLGDYVNAKLVRTPVQALLEKHLKPLVIENPLVAGPYIWFEHGFLSPTEGLDGFGEIRIYDVRPFVRPEPPPPEKKGR